MSPDALKRFQLYPDKLEDRVANVFVTKSILLQENKEKNSTKDRSLSNYNKIHCFHYITLIAQNSLIYNFFAELNKPLNSHLIKF
ncbi:hypothetical protein BpHYR1_011758 [Brachionus plicatilis]|uniref:Uncharacterized protein n=1 Tax=Brachionus plicatilis TaxID=10195 RepID=A0A3M7P8H5_BRAPC|nr:hypothetical protein BpHYR1_011758 [Brachionus plicatilis]